MSADEYKAVSCTPCDRTLWKMLKAAESGNIPKGFTTKADSPMFDHIRQYKSLEDVPCCAENKE